MRKARVQSTHTRPSVELSARDNAENMGSKFRVGLPRLKGACACPSFTIAKFYWWMLNYNAVALSKMQK